MGVVLMDFHNALDKVPHCQKIKHRILSDLVIWRQRLEVDGFYSVWKSVTSG